MDQCKYYRNSTSLIYNAVSTRKRLEENSGRWLNGLVKELHICHGMPCLFSHLLNEASFILTPLLWHQSRNYYNGSISEEKRIASNESNVVKIPVNSTVSYYKAVSHTNCVKETTYCLYNLWEHVPSKWMFVVWMLYVKVQQFYLKMLRKEVEK